MFGMYCKDLAQYGVKMPQAMCTTSPDEIRYYANECCSDMQSICGAGAGGGGGGGIQHLKNASLSSCMLHATWQDMIESAEWETRFATGGLGKLMVPDLYEVWLCDSKHECAAPGDMMCFTFNEQGEYFEPLALNSQLQLVKGQPDTGSPGSCDESFWPDKDHGLICGECKVLVDNFDSIYQTCDGYCTSIGKTCVGAWEEDDDFGDSCQVKFNMTCNQTLDSSDAICQCSPDSASGGASPQPDYSNLKNCSLIYGAVTGTMSTESEEFQNNVCDEFMSAPCFNETQKHWQIHASAWPYCACPTLKAFNDCGDTVECGGEVDASTGEVEFPAQGFCADINAQKEAYDPKGCEEALRWVMEVEDAMEHGGTAQQDWANADISQQLGCDSGNRRHFTTGEAGKLLRGKFVKRSSST